MVLVHGFYHGGWCWRGVADLLEVRGHKVYAYRLPATATARIFSVSTSGLDTQIADIANLVIWEDLNDVCLLRIRLAAVPRRARFASARRVQTGARTERYRVPFGVREAIIEPPVPGAAGKTSRYMPSPSLILYALPVGFAFRTCVSFNGMTVSPRPME